MGSLSLLGTLLITLVGVGVLANKIHQLNRNDFPPDFVFGAGTSAYQVEGASAEDGRSPSIWDTFTHAGEMLDNSTADVSADQYHKYKEDVKLMHDMGLDAYRFSISWSRLIPGGRGAVNPRGLLYYNNLINELLKYGIQPHVTLHHFDLPQVLEDEYGGWLSESIVRDFTMYSDICFREFGDRVPYWSTLNEPNAFSMGAYDKGILPPQHCSSPYGLRNCSVGNSSTEPYIVTHNQLLAHASVVKLYKQKYKSKQQGQIGLTILAYWFVPKTNRTEDVAATQRALDFMHGWFFNPLVFGDYPDTMKENVGPRLPSFSKRQSALVKGSFDFIGINHYVTMAISDDWQSARNDTRDYMEDMLASFASNSTSSGSWLPLLLPNTPWGMQGVLEYIKTSYRNPPIFVHENGYAMPYALNLNDTERVNYLNGYLEYLLRAVRNGSDTKGYFIWSFLDVFEVLYGFKATYGLYEVNFNDKELHRHARLSARWYSDFLNKKSGWYIEEPAISESQSAKY
ncbi:beta-glucosidase 22-like isoform X4 [Nymphaea colorata]|uniref:beta-glucosidase 22-like isoform X4 n=1 Tax=Nymphaea colorata TaxID=210225 RepID=UPI00129DA87D|nr:beta-glucosidase 22-like isoform X4 [Nymphaea colorata]